MFRENTTTHCLQSEVCRAVQGELKIWRIINDTSLFLCSKKRLFRIGCDIEEDGKTAKAVRRDQQEFYNEIGRIINTESDVKEDEKTVKAVLEDQR